MIRPRVNAVMGELRGILRDSATTAETLLLVGVVLAVFVERAADDVVRAIDGISRDERWRPR